MTAIIEFHDISKNFGGVQALRDVSFAVPRGEVHALTGENGSGKSTLIRICGGVFPPSKGRLVFDGREVVFSNPLQSLRAGISVVHQEIPICPDLTAAENVFLSHALPTRGRLIDWTAVNERAASLFASLDVPIDSATLGGDLPIAHQQVVVIAQALAHDAKLLILDEPTSALSRQETDRLFGLIDQLKRKGISVIYVSHRLDEVFTIADRISTLRDGEYVGTVSRAETTPSEVVRMMVGRHIEDLFPRDAATRSDEVLLEVRNLSKPGRFEGVSFDLHRGEILGLVGLQGSGTSEVLSSLFGRYGAIDGTIRLSGEPISITSPGDAIERGFAYVAADRQREGLIQAMTVAENASALLLRVIRQLGGWIPTRRIREKVEEMRRTFQIRTVSIDTPITSLSGGNQQKVVIARSLSTQPQILLLDDPTRGIDVGAKVEVHQLLNKLTAEGRGVVLVSSELNEVLSMSDRVLVMFRGSVRAALERREADHSTVMEIATGALAAA
jgi:ABC-type sugar transport system ATPase subunit